MKKVIIILFILVIVLGAFWAKGYYNDRYVVSDTFYTQIPLDTINVDSWLVDKDGVKQVKGKEYKLFGYNGSGDKIEVSFSKQ